MRALLMILLLGTAAQAGQLYGRVTDTEGNPVILASIQGYSRCTKPITMHARSLQDGWYALSTPNRPCYITTFYATKDGYVTSWPHIFFGIPNGTVDFILERSAKPRFLQREEPIL